MHNLKADSPSQTFFKELPPELQNDMVEELREIGNPQKIMLGLHLAVTISPMMLLTGVQWHKHNMDRSNVIHVNFNSQPGYAQANIVLTGIVISVPVCSSRSPNKGRATYVGDIRFWRVGTHNVQ